MVETEAAPATLEVTATNPLAIHPKVGMATVAGAFVATLIGIAKAKWGVDLSGYEANLTVLAVFAAGYITPS